jgi:Na+/H+ antiporter NhaD/arsenite permease-like protein
MSLVDWELLVLFMGLFVVNHALQATGSPRRPLQPCRTRGSTSTQPAALWGATFVLSNLVSNVPAVMLLLPAATGPTAGVGWRWSARWPATC